MARKPPPRFNPKTFLATVGKGKTPLTFPKKTDYLFAMGCGGMRSSISRKGQVKLSVVSPTRQRSRDRDSRAGIPFLGSGASPGSWCVWPRRAALEHFPLLRIDKQAMIRLRSTTIRPSASCSSHISCLATFAFKRTWWINFSIPARSGWRGCCSYWPISGKKASRRRSFLRSVRKCWPR